MSDAVRNVRIAQALQGLYYAITSGKCERFLVIGINKRDPLDNLIIVDYPEGEHAEFREQLMNIINSRMADS